MTSVRIRTLVGTGPKYPRSGLGPRNCLNGTGVQFGHTAFYLFKPCSLYAFVMAGVERFHQHTDELGAFLFAEAQRAG